MYRVLRKEYFLAGRGDIRVLYQINVEELQNKSSYKGQKEGHYQLKVLLRSAISLPT